ISGSTYALSAARDHLRLPTLQTCRPAAEQPRMPRGKMLGEATAGSGCPGTTDTHDTRQDGHAAKTIGRPIHYPGYAYPGFRLTHPWTQGAWVSRACRPTSGRLCLPIPLEDATNPSALGTAQARWSAPDAAQHALPQSG